MKPVETKQTFPEPTQAKRTAYIENWKRAQYWLSRSDVLIGSVSQHLRQDDFETNMQVTSPLLSFDPVNNRAETQNTIYILGKEAT